MIAIRSIHRPPLGFILIKTSSNILKTLETFSLAKYYDKIVKISNDLTALMLQMFQAYVLMIHSAYHRVNILDLTYIHHFLVRITYIHT